MALSPPQLHGQESTHPPVNRRLGDRFPMYQGDKLCHAMPREEKSSRPSEGNSQTDSPDQEQAHVTTTYQFEEKERNKG